MYAYRVSYRDKNWATQSLVIRKNKKPSSWWSIQIQRNKRKDRNDKVDYRIWIYLGHIGLWLSPRYRIGEE